MVNDVSQIIHWGPASNLEAYMQECGRAGRSGNASSALLFVRHRDVRSPDICKDMKDYCKRDRMCRRHFLAAYFEMDYSVISPRCCDICAGNCAAVTVCVQHFLLNYISCCGIVCHMGQRKPRCVSHFLPQFTI